MTQMDRHQRLSKSHPKASGLSENLGATFPPLAQYRNVHKNQALNEARCTKKCVAFIHNIVTWSTLGPLGPQQVMKLHVAS